MFPSHHSTPVSGPIQGDSGFVNLPSLRKAGIEPSPEGLAETITSILDSSPDFRRSGFDVSAAPLARIIDRDWREQLVLDMAEEAERRFQILSQVHPEPQALQQAVTEAVTTALRERDRILDLWQNCDRKLVIPSFGSAANEVWSEQLEVFTERLAHRMVRLGVSNQNGGAESGAMGRSSEAWRKHIEKYFRKTGLQSEAEVSLVYLKFNGDTREAPSELGSQGYISPAMKTFLSRTPLLFGTGQRAVELIYPGGLGTMEEALRALAESKLGTRVNGFYTHQPAPTTIFLSAVLPGETRPYWEPFKRLTENMLLTGAAKPDDFSRHFYDDVSEPSALVDLISEQFEEAKIRIKLEEQRREEGRSLPTDPRVEQERRVAGEVDNGLLADETFTQRRFGVSDPDYLRILDAHYEQQVLMEAEQVAVATLREKLGEGIEPEMAERVAVAEAIERARGWRDGLKNFLSVVQSEDVVSIVGSAKDRVWNQELEEFTDRFVRRAVHEGISLMVGGDGREGVSKRVRDAWFRAMGEYEAEHGERSGSKFLRVQLKIDGETTPAFAHEKGYSEILAPPLMTLIAKTPVLLSAGNIRQVVVYPGGPCEMEIVAGALLGSQLRDRVTTLYTGKERAPDITFLNVELGGVGPFYEPFKEQLEVIKRTGAAKASHMNNLHFTETDLKNGVLDSLFRRDYH